MKHPKVTILLPVYNGEKFVKLAIESMLAQTYRDFEFLIIDDGSTDSTPAILKSYNDPRIRIITHTPNRGLIETLNHGIQEAQGEYIARMDADDISFPQRLKKQVSFLDHHRDVGLCGSLMTCNITERIYNHRYHEPNLVMAALTLTNPIVHPSVMMRKELFAGAEDLYSKDFPHAEDYALWIHLLKRTRIAVLPETLIRYGAHDDQMSRKFNTITRDSVRKAHNGLFRLLDLQPTDAEKETHASLFFEEYKKNDAYVDAAEAWLLKLLDANRRKGLFHAASLAEIAGEWWFRLNRELSVYGFGSYTRFKASSLSKGYKPGTEAVMKLRIKSILKTQK